MADCEPQAGTVEIEEELSKSHVNCATSVTTARALPDGLEVRTTPENPAFRGRLSRLAASFAGVLAVASTAFGWSATITANDECEGLQYSQAKKSVYQSATGCHYAEFELTCELDDVPAGSTAQFQWTAVYQSNLSNPPAGAIWVPSPGTAQSTVGWAFDTTGLYTAQCIVTLTKPDQTVEQQTASNSFLVAGGPLKLGVARGEFSWQSPHDVFSVPTIENDNGDPRQPHYLQFFGYNPTGTSFPVLSQRPQLGTVAWYKPVVADVPGMDGATTFEWHLGSSLAPMPGQGDLSQRSAIVVGAIAASGVAGILPRCTQTVRFRGRVYPILDNSDQSPHPDFMADGPDIDHYTFTAHKPQDLLPNPEDDISGPITSHPHGWFLRTKPVLIDNVGHRMPNVWIQERFQPPALPPNWAINGQDTYWTTEEGEGNGHPAGRLGVGANTNGYDNLEIFGPEPWRYSEHPAAPKYNMVHHYYAANRRTSGTSGIFVGTYRIKFWTDNILHVKE